MASIKIGIIGDFDSDSPIHAATNDAIQHAAEALRMSVASTWIPTPELAAGNGSARLEQFHGLWAGPGSPYASMTGMLTGIRFARERGWPFLGT
jgi:CTP synthase (UTP-ammonia lyase)